MTRTIILPDQKKVIAIGTYRGKSVRGVAKCDPKDTFNPETGKKLAIARLDQRLNYKRRVTALQRLDELDAKMEALRTQFEKLSEARERTQANLNDLYDESIELEDYLAELLSE